MLSARQTFAINDDLPIRTEGRVHSGKVRSVYFLSDADSTRLIERHGYAVPATTPLAVMVISDRLSAFDCLWGAAGGLDGVPGKGAALNAIANHWFGRFREAGLAPSHILATPHPLVWIVQRARPVRIEAIARQYLTGSMWRSYASGERSFCGLRLPDGLPRDSRLSELLITPSTKGVLRGLEGVPEQDDVNVSRTDLERHWRQFGFASPDDIAHYERLLVEGFRLIERDLAKHDQIFVDTKFEFGYVTDAAGKSQLIYMDEVGTPDSSRIWDGPEYRSGRVVERSKESFRQALLDYLPDPTVLLDKDRFPERQAVAAATRLPVEIFAAVAQTYSALAERITGRALPTPTDPRAEIIQVLSDEYGLIR